MIETEDGFKLESGREFYAHRHLLCPDGDSSPDVGLSYGYDGHVWVTGGRLTAKERREIADHFIAIWKRWAARATKRSGTP